MNIKYLILLASLWLSGCSGMNQPAVVIDTGVKTVGALQPSGTPSPTVTATSTPTATLIDYGPIPITQTALALDGISLQQQAQSLELKRQAKALDDENAAATATWAVPTETKAASLTQTPLAAAQETLIARPTQTKQAIDNQADQAKVDFQTEINQWVPVVFIVVLLVLIAVGVMAVRWIGESIRIKREARKITERVQQAQPAQPEKMTITMDSRDGYGYGSVDFTTCPLDAQTLKLVAERISLGGARYTERQMTGSGNPLVKDGNFDTFGDWMVTNKIAKQQSDGRYTIDHPEFFEQVLEK